jgi:FixJ family two-component response regulator
MIVEAIKAGAKDFIVKPFKPERLAAAIARALAD